MKGYLIVQGNANVFCPHCGKVLWEELPQGKECKGCSGEITCERSQRGVVTMEYINKLRGGVK